MQDIAFYVIKVSTNDCLFAFNFFPAIGKDKFHIVKTPDKTFYSQ